jgi:predicted XRE-type DNA-binding protein
MEEEIEVFVGCGNVFADLGLPNPEERQLKAYLIMEIEQAISSERLTKKQAAQRLELSQHNLAELLEGAISKYTVNQLVQYLNCLGRDVELSASVRERALEAKGPAQQERQAVAA